MQPAHRGHGDSRRGRMRGLSLLLAVLLAAGLLCTPPERQQAARAAAFENQVSVILAPGSSIAAFNAAHGTSTVAALPDGRTYVLDLPEAETPEGATMRWGADPALTTIEPNVPEQLLTADEAYLTFHESYLTFHGSIFPDDVQSQWALSTIEAPAAQALSAGNGVTVAVLDTGVDTTHLALASHIAPGGYDYIAHTTAISDTAGGPVSGHGTFVAGLIAQVAPAAAILPYRVLDPSGMGTVGDVASAVESAAHSGARVINLSMGMAVPSATLQEAIHYAQDSGAVVVASAGNQAATAEQYPAAVGGVVAVAGTDRFDRRAAFSNYGPWVVVSAPAVDLYSTYPGGYAEGSGTSFAAPLVSGELALVLAAQPALSAEAAAQSAAHGSVPIDGLNPGFAALLGTGRIDALRALAAAAIAE